MFNVGFLIGIFLGLGFGMFFLFIPDILRNFIPRELRILECRELDNTERFEVQSKILWFWWTIQPFSHLNLAQDLIQSFIDKKNAKNFKSKVVQKIKI